MTVMDDESTGGPGRVLRQKDCPEEVGMTKKEKLARDKRSEVRQKRAIAYMKKAGIIKR